MLILIINFLFYPIDKINKKSFFYKSLLSSGYMPPKVVKISASTSYQYGSINTIFYYIFIFYNIFSLTVYI